MIRRVKLFQNIIGRDLYGVHGLKSIVAAYAMAAAQVALCVEYVD